MAKGGQKTLAVLLDEIANEQRSHSAERETRKRSQLKVGSERARPYYTDDQNGTLHGNGKKQSRNCESKMSSQAIVQPCRATKHEGYRSNTVESGTFGSTHPLLRWH